MQSSWARGRQALEMFIYILVLQQWNMDCKRWYLDMQQAGIWLKNTWPRHHFFKKSVSTCQKRVFSAKIIPPNIYILLEICIQFTNTIYYL